MLYDVYLQGFFFHVPLSLNNLVSTVYKWCHCLGSCDVFLWYRVLVFLYATNLLCWDFLHWMTSFQWILKLMSSWELLCGEKKKKNKQLTWSKGVPNKHISAGLMFHIVLMSHLCILSFIFHLFIQLSHSRYTSIFTCAIAPYHCYRAAAHPMAIRGV